MLKELLEANAERICQLITDEHGKVLADSLGELQRGIENVGCCEHLHRQEKRPGAATLQAF